MRETERHAQPEQLQWAGRARRWLALGGLLLAGAPAWGQTDSLTAVAARFRHYAARTPLEKLFGHLDRPAYLSGETLWLALYAVEGTTQRPLPASTVAYVELLDAARQPMGQVKLALRDARGQGALELPASLPTGRYTVRAYTSWMRNFGPSYYFHQEITVVNTRQPAAVPVASRPAATPEARFFPEGGYLVQGISGLVGFQLTDAAGRPLAATGSVVDAGGRPVAQFRTLWAGLGSFSFTPTQAGGAYRALVRLPNGQTSTYPLPPVQAQGYGLHLEAAEAGQLRVIIQARGSGAASAAPLYLLAHARQQVVVAATVPLSGGRAELLLPARQLPPGVSHFTLFDGQRRPVCERLYFRPPTDTLAVRVQATKSQYASREPVTLRLAAPGAQPASFSVAVYQLDSLSAAGGPDISSYLWLAADLPGGVEHPGRYCQPGPEAAAAADNLMLTQGWSRFRWAEVLAGRADSLAYLPELNGPLLQGRVLNSRTGAPVPNLPVYVATPSRRVQLYAALSQADGRFALEAPDLYGPRLLVIQPDLHRDSLSRVELTGSFAPPGPVTGPGTPPLALATGWQGSLARRHAQAEVQQRFPALLPARVPAPDSTTFYGVPSERYYLDRYTRFKVMEEVLREYVPGVVVRKHRDGFHLLVPDYQNSATPENPLVLLDGVPVFNTDRLMAFDPLKVRRLDVQTSRYFLGPVLHNGLISFSTYKGDLAGFDPDPRALLQEYDGLQSQREFYAPRYDTPAAAQSRRPDLRNLLYWNPAVRTQPGTDTPLTFYTSDQAGRYRVVVQGLGDDGRTGSTSFTLEVKPTL